ncbi:ribosomal protein L7/L12 [Methylocystis sp. ATCC 49242]|uniref:ribosomal protein L7/L12 n=1 Tax=Methylocystis sp. ATCC 49242 TaxID=622637 RepID=UPI0001F870F7|nr:ribosomal protein L7/L12 [Methylocystis sp. ATCC 49242]
MNTNININADINPRIIIETVKVLTLAGHKITAIRLIRSITGWGLKESKDYIENNFVTPIRIGDIVIGLSSSCYKVLGTYDTPNGTSYLWVVDAEGDINSKPTTLYAKNVKKRTSDLWDDNSHIAF